MEHSSIKDWREHRHRMFEQAEGEEVIARRTSNSKHYHLGGNRYQAIIYAEPVHYQTSDGKWQDIDNTLEEVVDKHGRTVLRNRSHKLRVEFPRQMDDGNMVTLTHKGRSFGWRFEKKPVGNSCAARIRSGKDMNQEQLVKRAKHMAKYVGCTEDILRNADLRHEIETATERRASIEKMRADNVYSDVLPGVSVRYTLNGNRMKEDIIVANAEALGNTALRLPADFEYHVSENHELTVHDKRTGEHLYMMETPVVCDADGATANARIRLTDCGDYVRLEYLLDETFLADAVYPITIDPVVKTETKNESVADAYIWVKNPDTNYGTPYIMRCGLGSGGESISLIRFETLIEPKVSDTIIDAQLRVYAHDYGADREYMACYPILCRWEETEVTWNQMMGGTSATIGDEMMSYVNSTETGYHYFDITDIYRRWCSHKSDRLENYGIALRFPTETNSSLNYVEWNTTQYNSSKGPCMVINYISHAGRQGWWQYESMSNGRAGTAHVDLFNGNLVFEHADGGTTGAKMPVAIGHVYNSCLSTQNPVNCGNGWRTTMHQFINRQTIGSNNFYVWTDGQGTEHFFKISGSQPYEDEEGMSLKLKTSSGKLTITDKSDMKMEFVTPTDLVQQRLDSMTDAHGNTIKLIYDADGKLDEIEDGAGRIIKLLYDARELLTQMSIPGAPTLNYHYDCKGHLKRIAYSDVETAATVYCYEDGLLKSALNIDGVKTTITYDDEELSDARRVTSLEQSADSVNGAKRSFAYDHLVTKVTANIDIVADDGTKIDGTKTLTYQFNDAGNTVCVQDELGYAQCNTFSATIANQQESASKLQKVVVNRLSNVDFSGGWTSVLNGSDEAVQSKATRCMGMPSLKITKKNTGESFCQQSVAISAAGEYTFSAYVKSINDADDLFIRIRNADGAILVRSRSILGKTENVNVASAAAGWDRLYVTAHLPEGVATVEVVSNSVAGSGYFACPQLETGKIPNRVNLLVNSDFSNTTDNDSRAVSWEASSGITNPGTRNLNGIIDAAEAKMPAMLTGKAMRIHSYCNTGSNSHIQQLDVKGSEGDVYVVGAWMDSESVSSGAEHFAPCLITRFQKSDGNWTSWKYNEYSPERVGWKFGAWAVKATAAYKKMEFGVQYARNNGVGMFANTFVHREEFGESFAYDDNKNVVSVAALSTQKSNITYDDANNIKTYQQPGAASGVKYTMNYGSTSADRKRHLLMTSTTPMGVKQTNTYDAVGNLLNTTNQKNSSSPLIKTETTYNDNEDTEDKINHSFVATQTDARGKVVTYTTDTESGLVTKITDPAGNEVNYTHDASKRVTGVQSGGSKNAYTYENDRIKTVAHNTTGDDCDVVYEFGYDALGRKTTVKAGNQVLSTNVYKGDRSALLASVEYGNGGSVHYGYDEFDRLKTARYDGSDSDAYVYEYGANGQVSHVTDHLLGRVAQTNYDLSERPMGTQLRTLDDALLYRTELEYDIMNRLAKFCEVTPTSSHSTAYTYDNDNRVTQIAFDGSAHKVRYTYDTLGRVESRAVECGAADGKLTSTYGYVEGGYGQNSTTTLVASIDQAGICYSYTYDDRGNIVSETRNGMTTTYAYDALGQLIRVNDPHENATWVYTYDHGGNILSKERYAYSEDALTDSIAPVETIPYTYGDANWKDKLTNFNGNEIIYDEIGNPLNDGMWTYTWQHGRQLASMESDERLIEFKYDHNGMRVEKKVTNKGDNTVETTKYVYHGKKLMEQQKGADVLHFYYDAEDRPTMVAHNGEMYTYLHSLQGDIAGIVDSTGNVVVEYKYDAWGNPLSTTGDLADALGERNPFRYRGYLYDAETDLYYLASRYYDTAKDRFINADSIFVGNQNLFCYCSNNPIRNADPNGRAKNDVLIQRGRNKCRIMASQQRVAANNINKLCGKRIIADEEILKAINNPLSVEIMKDMAWRTRLDGVTPCLAYAESNNLFVCYATGQNGKCIRYKFFYDGDNGLDKEDPLIANFVAGSKDLKNLYQLSEIALIAMGYMPYTFEDYASGKLDDTLQKAAKAAAQPFLDWMFNWHLPPSLELYRSPELLN